MTTRNITAAERVELARSTKRPVTSEYIENIFDNFIKLSGDRNFGDDESIIGGIATFKGIPVTVIGHQKGRNIEDNLKYRFGMPNPEGYRKAMRLMKQAEKFKRPLICFIDTPGAYPGKEAEERGQGMAIAECIQLLAGLEIPTIAVFIGEGGSGGALALGVADRMIMLENSIFSILSPEGFASILWHDAERWREAAEAMKLTAQDLKALGICDVIVDEPDFEEEGSKGKIYRAVSQVISSELSDLMRSSGAELARKRYKRLRSVGK